MLMIEKKYVQWNKISNQKNKLFACHNQISKYIQYTKIPLQKNIIRITKIQTIWSKFILEFMRKYRIELKKIFVFSFYLSCLNSLNLFYRFFFLKSPVLCMWFFQMHPECYLWFGAVERCWVDEFNRLNPTNGR